MKLKNTLVLSALVVVAVLGAACRQVAPVTDTQKPLYYTCLMHPSVHAEKPGDCPDCGMHLVPVFTETNTPAAGCCGAPAQTGKP